MTSGPAGEDGVCPADLEAPSLRPWHGKRLGAPPLSKTRCRSFLLERGVRPDESAPERVALLSG